MDKDFYLLVAEKYIDSIENDGLYCTDYSGEDGPDTFTINKDMVCIPFTVMSGATKVVLIGEDESYDYVIKLPFKGSKNLQNQCQYDWCCPPDMEDKHRCGRCKFITIEEKISLYEGAINEEKISWNYCASEETIYNRSKLSDLDNFFLETIKIGEYKDVPIYLQKKASSIGLEDHPTEPSKESHESLRKLFLSEDNLPIDNDFFGACLIEYYGEKQCQQFFEFLRIESINDLHDGNVGFLHERPVIVDFSGYHG